MSHDLTFTDAYELVSKKILINRMSLENLDIQIKYANDVMKLQAYTIRSAKAKKKLIEELNPILEKQLKEFCEIRQQECKNIIDNINDIDECPDVDYFPTLKSCEKNKNQLIDLSNKIQHLYKTIPNELDVTNYKIKALVVAANTCAQETLPID
jgi:hypothetical protein